MSIPAQSAASVYARCGAARNAITRIVLLGPAHRVAVRGMAVPSHSGFATPLGVAPLDRAAIESIKALPQVHEFDAAHAAEHSLEVHLPFLQHMFESFTLVPIVVGDAEPPEVADVLRALWCGPETLVVVSSDLSHYHDYDTAAVDRYGDIERHRQPADRGCLRPGSLRPYADSRLATRSA